MKATLQGFFLTLVCSLLIFKEQQAKDTLWTVVGAGPAGIAIIGLLIDLGVDPSVITWIDDKFNVGRLGELYEDVPGNATTKMYIEFLTACHAFQECAPHALDELYRLDLNTAYPLHVIVNPLRDITACFKTRVNAIQGTISSLHFQDDWWHIGVGNEQITSYNVVLATGSHPKELDYPVRDVIPLDIAINKELLAQHVRPDDTIAVIGSAHSAILILRYLSELPVSRCFNFYKKPIVYSTPMGDWVQFQEAGLKGSTAWWAKNVLEKNPPAKLIRILNTPAALNAWLPVCTKIIYAIGFERNPLPPINGNPQLVYDDISGVIAQRLFGVGIAFPEKVTTPDGNAEHRVGLKFFMDYAQRVVPEWIASKRTSRGLSLFEQLFAIDAL